MTLKLLVSLSLLLSKIWLRLPTQLSKIQSIRILTSSSTRNSKLEHSASRSCPPIADITNKLQMLDSRGLGDRISRPISMCNLEACREGWSLAGAKKGWVKVTVADIRSSFWDRYLRKMFYTSRLYRVTNSHTLLVHPQPPFSVHSPNPTCRHQQTIV